MRAEGGRSVAKCFALTLLIIASSTLVLQEGLAQSNGIEFGYLSMVASGPTSYIGFKVTILGEVVRPDGTSLSNATVYLWFRFRDDPRSLTDDLSWNIIAVTRTSQDGSFSLQWIPTATGDYMLRGSLCPYPVVVCAPSGSPEPIVPFDVFLSVLPTGDQHMISVASNSTISGLGFNSTSQILEFELSGDTGKAARVDVSISKALLSNANQLQVKANSVGVPFDISSSGDQWLVAFTVRFESVVRVSLDIEGSQFAGLEDILAYFVFPLLFVGGLVLGLRGRWLYKKFKPRLKATPSTATG